MSFVWCSPAGLEGKSSLLHVCNNKLIYYEDLIDEIGVLFGNSKYLFICGESWAENFGIFSCLIMASWYRKWWWQKWRVFTVPFLTETSRNDDELLIKYFYKFFAHSSIVSIETSTYIFSALLLFFVNI